MSDSNDEGFFRLPFFVPPSQEMLDMMREAQDRQEMVADDYRHSTSRLFDTMTEDQLTTLKTIFHVMVASASAKDRALGAYYEGVIVGILHARFNICLGCDHNHDKLMEEQMEREKNAVQQEPLVASDGGDPFAPGTMGTTDCPVGGNGMLSDRQVALMAEYNLDDMRDENLYTLLGFVCLKCGMKYPTIEDRMLKGVDDCSGCHQKEMWG